MGKFTWGDTWAAWGRQRAEPSHAERRRTWTQALFRNIFWNYKHFFKIYSLIRYIFKIYPGCKLFWKTWVQAFLKNMFLHSFQKKIQQGCTFDLKFIWIGRPASLASSGQPLWSTKQNWLDSLLPPSPLLMIKTWTPNATPLFWQQCGQERTNMSNATMQLLKQVIWKVADCQQIDPKWHGALCLKLPKELDSVSTPQNLGFQNLHLTSLFSAYQGRGGSVSVLNSGLVW